MLRVSTIGRILEDQLGESAQFRSMPSSLALGASLIQMLNALVSRPRDWRAERYLADAASMQVPRNLDVTEAGAARRRFDAADMIPVGELQGAFFLCALVRDDQNKWWRLPESHVPEHAQLCVLFRAGSIAEIATNMGGTGIRRVAIAANPMRLGNRRSRTIDRESVCDQQAPLLDLGLDDIQVDILEPVQPSGPDVLDFGSDMADEDDPDHLGARTDLRNWVSRLYAQFFFDIVQQSPNHLKRSDGPYITLSVEERNRANEGMFQRAVLPFNMVYHRAGNWDQQFNRLFPDLGSNPGRVQGLTSCKYYQDWHLLMTRISATVFRLIRGRIRTRFFHLTWLPYTESDRLWCARKPSQLNKWTYLSKSDDPTAHIAAVKIAFNPAKYTVARYPILGHAIPEEEEEEEEEDPRHAAPPPRPSAEPYRPIPQLGHGRNFGRRY